MDRVGLGDPLDVFDRLDDPVAVFVPRIVALVKAVEVDVFDPF